MEITTIILLICIGIIGFVAGKLIEQKSAKSAVSESENEALKSKQELETAQKQTDYWQKQSEKADLRIQQLIETKASQEKTIEYLQEQTQTLKKVREDFNKEFNAIADKLFKEHARSFSETSKSELNQHLLPFKDQLKSFEEKVESLKTRNIEQHAALNNQLKSLTELNKTIGKEAENLINALKGDNQKQGAWGEVILERVLEESGLQKNREYEVQHSTSNQESRQIKPDVIVHLPENKHIIIDSKVSLKAYEQYVSANDNEERKRAGQLHAASLKKHIAGLSHKQYETAKGLTAPDFVLLFLPIEAAFSTALQSDPKLFTDAWEKRIVIVSPTTLLATLKTIESIWKQERQNNHTKEIAEQGGRLYDKFVNFIADLERVDKELSQAQKALDEAHNKLHTGKGNLVSRAEKMKKLGAKARHQIPDKFTNDE
ncbi:DNA recombination protein RmuC [Salibacter sp.]|jgi:DNA recombination protein RmuC|uniref:DNA recombination protein RmuC n=1 Tax=Salibacter sp. TaxID=2010995 RepID=UPI0028702852|nr:DNA recombination protein RmuC [Salibacter sp.]MDR9397507.1 DNA recombination protein RmuC [Salibacter sp.]MDR9488520.1 DNA recombination protein RmuC [Salibacter sp.]